MPQGSEAPAAGRRGTDRRSGRSSIPSDSRARRRRTRTARGRRIRTPERSWPSAARAECYRTSAVTVRAWFTISALVLVALAAAFGFRLFASNPAPEIVVRAGDVRLERKLDTACWPQRSGQVECSEAERADDPRYKAIPSSGTLRILVAYPVQPTDGSIWISERNSSR